MVNDYFKIKSTHLLPALRFCRGDLLVSCDNGHAIANNIAGAGTIIGKSLENFTDASGVIEVAVGRF